MKVSIMSMQRIANYGSFLQAYALKKTIEMLGHQVDFADYRVQTCLIQSQKVEQGRDTYIKDKAFRLMNAIKCFAYKIPFDQHKQFYQNYSGKYLRIIGVSDERRERPDTDVLVIGSDEVFNCVQSNPDVGCSMELFGKDSRAKKIISYAASFGNTGIKELRRFDVQDEIAELLKKFTAISVRDKNSEAIVKEFDQSVPGFEDDAFLTGQDSTILDISGIKAKILRQGSITKADLLEQVPELSFEEDHLTMEYRDKTRKKVVQIPYRLVSKARLAVKF